MEIAFLLMIALPFVLYGVLGPLHRIRTNGRRWVRVHGIDVPGTQGTLFVSAIRTSDGGEVWRVTHARSGMSVSGRWAFTSQQEAIEAAEHFWMEIDDVAQALLREGNLTGIAKDRRYMGEVMRATIATEANVRLVHDDGE